jgi:hypothetical protein
VIPLRLLAVLLLPAVMGATAFGAAPKPNLLIIQTDEHNLRPSSGATA